MAKTLRLMTLLIFPAALVGLFSAIAMADGAPVDPAVNPSGALDQFWGAIASKKWGIAAVFGTMLLVALVRFVAPKVHGKFGTWVSTSRVSASLALIAGFLMALATQLLKGGHWTPQLFVYGFGGGVMAIGGYNAFWDLLFPNDKVKITKLADSAAEAAKGSGGGGTAKQALIFLALLSVFMAVPGCTVFKQCINASGITSPSTVEGQVGQALDGAVAGAPAGVVGALEGIFSALLPSLGKDAAVAMECAITAWKATHPLPSNASPDPKLLAAHQGANQWLAQHFTPVSPAPATP